MDDNPVPYFPGMQRDEAIEKLVKTMMASSQQPDCLFCGTDKTPGVVGASYFEGDAAVLMGARPGKSRAAVYYVCAGCLEQFGSAEAMSEACEAALARQAAALSGDTKH